MPTERLANLGYMAIKKETTKGTAVTPTVFLPIYSSTLTTAMNLDEDNPVMGNKAIRWQVVPGMRDHQGEIKVLAEPNTAGYMADMILAKGTTTGSDPYTHPFTLASTNPNSYTVDISTGSMVQRYAGVEASEMGIEFDANKMVFNMKISALKSFSVREISSVVGAVVTFKTNYDPSPTDGLVASDIVRIKDVSAGTTQDFTISTIDSTTAITLNASPTGIVSGDLFYIRPASAPTYTMATPFTWSRTEFRFGDDASTALSATQTRIDEGGWKIMHNFEDEAGAKRSGSYDPAALVRTQGDVELNIKQFFDTPEDMNKFFTTTKKALVVRSFSGTGHEIRLTINNFKFSEYPTNINTSEIVYAETVLMPTYDTSDSQMFDLKVINAVATI